MDKEIIEFVKKYIHDKIVEKYSLQFAAGITIYYDNRLNLFMFTSLFATPIYVLGEIFKWEKEAKEDYRQLVK